MHMFTFMWVCRHKWLHISLRQWLCAYVYLCVGEVATWLHNCRQWCVRVYVYLSVGA